jgi:hypothetical protein
VRRQRALEHSIDFDRTDEFDVGEFALIVVLLRTQRVERIKRLLPNLADHQFFALLFCSVEQNLLILNSCVRALH